MNPNASSKIEHNCETAQCIHPHIIERVRSRMPESRHLVELSDFYKLFGDATRLRILTALSIAELCVCDLGTLLDMKQRRDGKVVYYTLCDEHIRNVLQVGMEHLGEQFETAENANYATSDDEAISG